MKKLFTLAALSACGLLFSQENNDNAALKPHTISVHANYSDPSQLGLTYEAPDFITGESDSSTIINLSYGSMNYDADVFDIDGTGFVLEFGSRSYYNKSNTRQGFYSANYLTYGNIKFDEDDFEGNYSYFSFFSPEIGYKIVLGDFSIDPSIGAMWKIEIKGSGDVDNRYTDEWAVRAGIRIGYSF